MGKPKKYNTEEERLEARKKYLKQWRETNKERIVEYSKQRYQDDREKILEQEKQYRKDNAEKIAERKRQYRKDNAERIAEYNKQYSKTPMGRAVNLVNAHNKEDKKYNRGECTLTAKWVVENIFTSKCIYCGESDWTKLGCDRIDNNKPHTEDNVVCCCEACNKKRGTKPFQEFLNENKNCIY